ncbi:MAG: glycosyltransferase family 4 protein, partial [Elusimicrobiota bacterium]
DSRRLKAYGARPHPVPGWPWGSHFKRRVFATLSEALLSPKEFDLVWGHGDSLRQDVLSLHNCVHAAHEALRGTALSASSGVGRIHERQLREKSFRLLIANSSLMKDELMRRFAIPEGLLSVVHPGHDPVRFRPGGRRELGLPLRRRLGIPEDALLAGFITSGDFKKRGLDIFLEALSRLSAPIKDRVHALVLGKESRLGAWRENAVSTGLGSRLHFLPPVDKVESAYHALDVYCHPARYEEFGQSVQEAMACAVPVLTSRRVGACELFGPLASSLLADAPEAGDLARNLERVLVDEGLRAKLGAEGAEATRSNTWEANFNATLACLRRLL